jgi:hypothetical protein
MGNAIPPSLTSYYWKYSAVASSSFAFLERGAHKLNTKNYNYKNCLLVMPSACKQKIKRTTWSINTKG